MMVEGETRRIWVPQNMAYGATPPPTAPKGMLIFEVELLKILSN
jgi:FKBP-type peptidyl-prolyl cis-trans isomerase